MVARARAELSLDSSQFVDSVRNAGTQAQGAFDESGRSVSEFKGKAIDSAESTEGSFSSSMGRIGGYIAGAFTVQKLVQFGQEALRVADNVINLSDKLGISAESVQSLQFVAREAGIEFGKVEAAILKLSSSVVDARAGNEGLTDAFQNLGISVSDLDNMSTEEIFDRVAQAMANASGDATMLDSAFKILGERSGPALQNMLEKIGEEGLGPMNQRLKELGVILDEHAIKNLDKAEQKVSRFLAQMNVNNITAFADAIEWAGEKMKSAWGGSVELTERGKAALEAYEAQAKETARAEAEARREVNAARAQEKQTLDEITELTQESLRLSGAQKTPQQELNELVARQKEIQEELNRVLPITLESYRDMIASKNELSRLSTQIKDKEQQIGRAAEQAQEKINRLKQAYNALVFRGMTDTEKLTELEWRRIDIADRMLELEEQGLQNSAEYLQLQIDQLNNENAIKGLVERKTGIIKEGKELTVEMVENLVKMRETLARMNDGELEEFVERLKELARELSTIEGPDLEWLDKLTNFRLPTLFTSSQGSQLGRAIRSFIEALNQGAGNARIDPELMASLEKLGNIRLPRNFTSSQAGMIARAIRAFFDIINGVGLGGPIDPTALNAAIDSLLKLTAWRLPNIDQNQAGRVAQAIRMIAASLADFADIDLDKVINAIELIQELNNLGDGGTWQLEVTLPPGLEDGIELVIPDHFASNIEAIANMLHEMRGVVWA